MTGSSDMWNGEGWFTKGNVGCQDWEKGKETLGQQKKKKKTDSTTKIFEEFYYILRYIFFLKIISTIWTLEHQEYYMYPELKGGHRGGS